jgi:hypothetical protein
MSGTELHHFSDNTFSLIGRRPAFPQALSYVNNDSEG